ncbi:MAG: ATP-grasp domain-containing protein [Coriobacteriales bacterium]|jgi:D-aspartate ligase|nr:ATP-grasp domain-containing protein [Coriobacteriales bacterium]
MSPEVGTDDFIPLLFASDINVYSMARAFHEEYGCRAVSYGMANTGPCVDSRILEHRVRERADRPTVMLELINAFAQEHPEQTVIVVCCGDSYVRSLAQIRPALAANVVAPGISPELLDRLTNKERFYELCNEVGLDYPSTFIYREQGTSADDIPFELPWVIKPADGVQYWEHPFEQQDKVFIAKTRADADSILKRIYSSGYTASTIIQDFIPGDDSFMRVLTNYSDTKGQVKLMCLGHVLLEEHTPKGKGNHAVIITEQDLELEARFKQLLEKLGYTGFSNFDLKFDSRDGRMKVFECNVRQGRSNFYVTGAGANLAKTLVDDLVYRRDLAFCSMDEQALWMVVPEKVAFDYINPVPCRAKMRELIAAGRCTNPLLYKGDRSVKHRLRVEKSLHTQHDKFARFYGEHRYQGQD